MKVKNNSENDLQATVTTHIMPYVSATDTGSYIELLGSNTGFENRNVFVPDNMPDISQADFLKDIIQRFNLVILPNPETDKNLIIEPFNDYIDAGGSKDWENKLDKSKEIQVQFTNELMNQTIEFKDLEDKDQMNFNFTNTYNKIYGQFDKDNKDKEFAKQEALTNEPVFSAFIPNILQFNGTLPTGLDSFLIHRNYSNEGGEIKKTTTEPKLFHYSGTAKTISAFYSWYDAVNQTVQNINTYPFCSNFDSSPVTSSTKDLRWGNGWYYAFNSPALNGVYTNNNLYNVYWARYITELYSEEARMMTCYVNLNAEDISDFNFNDQIFINNCFWRVNKISDYQIGEHVTTKVELIKIVVKTSYECLQEPDNFVSDGTIEFVSTVNGSAVTESQECCEQWGFVWNPTDSTCRWKNYQVQHHIIPNQISSFTKSVNNNNLLIGSNEYRNSPQDSLLLSTRNIVDNFNSGMTILTYSGQTDDATLTEIFIQGLPSQRFIIPLNYFCTLRATMASVQTGLDNNTGSIGASSYTEWMGAVKNVGGTASVVGTQREAETPIKDSGIGKRDLTFGILNSEGDSKLTIKVQGEVNTRIQYAIDIKIEYTAFVVYNTDAIWMDDNNIVFQDGDQMLWN